MSGNRVIYRADAESAFAAQTGATKISNDVSHSFIDDSYLSKENAQRLDSSSVNHQFGVFDLTITNNNGDFASSGVACAGLGMGMTMSDPKMFVGYTANQAVKSVETNLLTAHGFERITYLETKRTALEVLETAEKTLKDKRVPLTRRFIGDGLDESQLALNLEIAPMTAQIKKDRVTVCNLANEINDIIFDGMKQKVLADEFDATDAAKAGRKEFGVCRSQLVSTDLACRERLIEVNGSEHMKFVSLFQMIRLLTTHKKCYGMFILGLT